MVSFRFSAWLGSVAGNGRQSQSIKCNKKTEAALFLEVTGEFSSASVIVALAGEHVCLQRQQPVHQGLVETSGCVRQISFAPAQILVLSLISNLWLPPTFLVLLIQDPSPVLLLNSLILYPPISR